MRWLAVLLASGLILGIVLCRPAPAAEVAIGPVVMRLHQRLFFTQEGIASRYNYSRRPTACGQRFDPRAFTAAHRTLRCGTWVTVTNKRNNRAITVRINDRGPFVRGRVIDLTPVAANYIRMDGLTPVRLEAQLGRP